MEKIIHKHKEILQSHKDAWKNKTFILSVFAGLILLVISLFVNYYAGVYSTKLASNSVTDIILSNLPVYNVNFIIVQGAFVFALIVAVIVALNPKSLPFVLKSLALFVVTRAIFVTMTHIAPFPQRDLIHGAVVNKFVVGGELFFSGHTGIPFLLALVFWENKFLRYLFLAFTLIAGTAVLMGHVHYTIDVFAAPFITYSIFIIAKKFFAKDYNHFTQKPNSHSRK